MSIVEILKEVAAATSEELDDAVRKLDEEKAEIQKNIISLCQQREFDCAWDCMAQFEKAEKMQKFLINVRGF